MSLKEQTKEIYARYGLSDDDFNVYLVFLGYTQSTISEVAGMLERDPNDIQAIANRLEEHRFIKKLPGIIDRYIPMEPYMELFNSQSIIFRDEILKIKDDVLADQSTRFENLENIENNAVGLVETAVKNQVNEFFTDSNAHDSDKKAVIDTVRDRFTETGKDLETEIQTRLFTGRDRYRTTCKTLESDLHGHIDADYEKFGSAVNTRDSQNAQTWDTNTGKFTGDNNQLNSELEQISASHNSQSKALEANLHNVVDSLNGELKSIADGFKANYDAGIQDQKQVLNQIVDDLLKDFAIRIEKLEAECKTDLDAHVDHHKDHAENLKPTFEEILEKYMLRMKAVVDELKNEFSALLSEHTIHFQNTADSLRDRLNNRVEDRQNQLIGQIEAFEKKTVVLVDNLVDISDKLTDLGTVLGKRGSAWKALILGRHKEWNVLYGEIRERVGKIGNEIKQEFQESTAGYLEATVETKSALQEEVTNITAEEKAHLEKETVALDEKQKASLNLELEGLATDLTQETDSTMSHNIEHCHQTTVSLKDAIENSLHSHKDDFDLAINKHRQVGINHYDTSNGEVVSKTDGWYGTMDNDHQTAKRDVSTETEKQIADTNSHLNKTKLKNDAHSQTFEGDVAEVKRSQRAVYDEQLKMVLDDFAECKQNISTKIDGEIATIEEEVKGMDDLQHQKIDEQIQLVTGETAQTETKLHTMLEDHKAKYQANATSLQDSLSTTVKDNIQNVKDAIADFTLNFMNSIDEASDHAEDAETALTDVKDASMAVKPLGSSATWHVWGPDRLIEAIIDAMWRVKSPITIITPTAEPRILEKISQVAYKKKSARSYTTQWDIATYGPIIEKMKVLGNIQFRNLKSTNDFYAVARDGEEIVLCPQAQNPADQVAIVSMQPGYAQIFSSFIYPIFQANSRPL